MKKKSLLISVVSALGASFLLAGAAQAATVYQLKTMTFQTSSAPGSYLFGGLGALAASACLSCGSSLVIDDDLGNLTVHTVQYSLGNFGADIIHTFSGTSTLGTTSLIKNPDETCVDGGLPATSPHLCNSADQRAWTGNWYNGLMADGVPVALTHQFSALVTGNNLVLRVRTNRDASPVNDPDWLQMNFNYQVVPIPAAAWLFGGALGLLGFVRRRTAVA